MHSRAGVLLALLLGIAFNTPVWSQIITGNMRGVIRDSNGEFLPGVTVEIHSKALTGESRSSITNEFGIFRFPALPVGIYSVEARLNGFQNIRANRVEVNLGGTANVPLTMKISKSETIRVVGDTPIIDSQNAGFSTSFKKEIVENIPTTRRMWVLMQVAPGVTKDNSVDLDPGIIAFGSDRQSNTWTIDGLDVTSPETGNPRFDINPDIIDQIQVDGIGTSAEYGNHMGAVLNVITKKGTNDLHGGANSVFQNQIFTGTNVRLRDSEFVFHRDEYYDITAQAGGPIVKDKGWFFGAIQSKRDSYSSPGTNPDYAPLTKIDRYDVKLNSRLAESYDLSGFFHHEKYDFPDPTNPYSTKSAMAHEFGNISAWRAAFTSSFQENTLFEIGFAGWSGQSIRGSQTQSLEDPFIFYDSQSGVNTYSGGLFHPDDHTSSSHQINAKTTYYAERFLKSQHEFKFGVQFFNNSATQISAIGPNGSEFNSGYYTLDVFKTYQAPYFYGSDSKGLGAYIDDTVTLNHRVTLNLGVRFDHNTGSIPDFERLAIGTPSISEIGNFVRTGEKIPGVNDFVRWNLVSPRLGFVWQTREDGRAAVRGSFGIYYDHDTTGNWFSPPPDAPHFQHFLVHPNGQLEYRGESNPYQVRRDRKLKPPRTLQYSLGYEFQPGDNSLIGIQFVQKDSSDLIGWQILGGEWSTDQFIDPFTGTTYTLIFPSLSSFQPPIVQKGNDPGDFPGSDGLSYFQKYRALILTFTKRFADSWTFNASYTWSKSHGLIPRMLSQFQSDPFFIQRDGDDPNNYVNATGRLQGDRTHMFRAQVVFLKLPWNLQTSASVDFSTGTPYNRQIRAFLPTGSSSLVIMEPAGSRRHSPIQNIDLSIGKKFSIDNRLRVVIDAEILNLLNSNRELQFATLQLQDPGQRLVPVEWVEPRRLQLQFGVQF